MDIITRKRQTIQKCLPAVTDRRFLHGTPERTLTSDLPLRRRTLYTTELLEHILEYCSGKYNGCQPQVSAVFCPLLPYTVFLRRKEEEKMRECSDPNVDLEDLLFDDDAGGPSER